MTKVIAIVGTLDTKGSEVAYLKELITRRGHKALAIDIGMGGKPSITADITAEEIAAAGGGNIEEIRASTDRHRCSQIMTAGAIKKVAELHSMGQLDGIIAIGGASATFAGTAIMGALPFGVPKLMVSSWVAVPTVNYFGTKDMTIMHSVVEAAGLNQFFKNVLSRAAGAICGMAEMTAPAPGAEKGKPFVAISGYGYTEKCVTYVIQALEERGYEPIRFHATGIGEKAMEELIEQGLFAAVIVAVQPAFLTRTAGGFADTDAYNVTIPLLITWLFLEAFETQNLKKKTVLATASGFLIGIYSFTWAGWWYIHTPWPPVPPTSARTGVGVGVGVWVGVGLGVCVDVGVAVGVCVGVCVGVGV